MLAISISFHIPYEYYKMSTLKLNKILDCLS